MSQTATYENTYWALAAEDVEYDFLYDGSEDSILFILEPDGTHTICQRLWQRLWPDLSDEHKALMITSLAQLTDERRWVVLGDEYGYGRNITARSVKSKHVAKIRIPDRPSKAFTAPKGKPENLPKAHKLRVRRKWARPRPKWKIDREMVRAAVKRERLLLALDRKRPVTYAAYTDENGNKVREPSEYRPRPAATKPRHPNYWVAYWEQWERRMNQLRRGSADPRGQVLKLREFIEDSARTSHYKKAGRDEMFWAGVFHRLMQQYDYACLDREGEVEPEEAKERYFDWTLPSDDGWGKVFVNTMSYVETYPVLHILTAFHEGGAEATLSAIECAGRRLKMYGQTSPLNVRRIGGVAMAENHSPTRLPITRKPHRCQADVVLVARFICHVNSTHVLQSLWRGLVWGSQEGCEVPHGDKVRDRGRTPARRHQVGRGELRWRYPLVHAQGNRQARRPGPQGGTEG